jgi:hypothetical protein
MAYLKQFGLTIPGMEKWKLRDFQLQTRCVLSLYSRLFETYKVKKCWKILVACVDEVVRFAGQKPQRQLTYAAKQLIARQVRCLPGIACIINLAVS